MLTHFERFMGGPRLTARDRVHVTLNHKSEINLNRRAYELLGEPSAVFLAYDRKNALIAVEPARERLREAFPVYAKSGTWVIHASPFCRHIGVRLDRVMKFEDPAIQPDHSLHLNLKTMTQAGWKIYKQKRK